MLALIKLMDFGDIETANEAHTKSRPCIEDSEIPHEVDIKNKCISVTDVHFPSNSHIEVIRSMSRCSNLETVHLPASLKRICDDAFAGLTNLKKICFDPACNLTSIGKDAFWGTMIRSLKLPNTISNINSGQLGGLEFLSHVSFMGHHEKYFNGADGSLYTRYPSGLVFAPRNKRFIRIREGVEILHNSSISMNSNLRFIEIPASVKEIGDSCFDSCENLKRIKFSKNSRLERIGIKSFRKCRLTNIFIPSSIKSIGELAFESCIELDEIGFQGNNRNIVQISKQAFDECESLRRIILPERVETLADGQLSGIRNCETIEVQGESNPIIYENETLLFVPRSIKEVTIKENCRFIGSYAFEGCSNIEMINIPRTLRRIKQGAFRECSIKSIHFEWRSQLEIIERSAFEKCESITEFNIPCMVKEIGDNCFSECSSLKSIKFKSQKHLSKIGSRAFNACSALEIFKLPKSVSKIGKESFMMSSIKTFIINSGSKLDSIPVRCFYNCLSLQKINIPSSIQIISKGAFEKCQNLTKIEIQDPNNLKQVDEKTMFNIHV